MKQVSWRAIHLLALSATALACYHSYTGIYWLELVRPQKAIAFRDLRYSVAAAIQEFGFNEFGFPEFEDQVTSWVHTKNTITARTAHLMGADARITVAVGENPLTIAIRDLTNNYETDFMRALKRAIEQRLEERYGIKGLRFERQRDFLS